MVGMTAASAKFPGHLGGHLIPPEASGSGSYQMLFAFDSELHLQAWTRSGERRVWLERIAEVTYGEDATRVLTGMEGWFTLPASDTRRPPPRHKMALVTWLGIFPLVLLLSKLIGPWLAPVSPVLSVMVVTALVTIVMTWWLMPRLVRLFAGWLYPKASASQADGPDSRHAVTKTQDPA